MMKTVKSAICVLLMLSAAAWAMPLGSSARTVIPSDIQQIISVDYRALKNSDTAMALKQQVLPPSLKEFEGALRGVGIDPDKDVEQLTFASYRSGKQGVRVVGVAQGQFPMAAFLKKMKLQKIKPIKLRNVVGLLRGSDPALKDTYVLVTGHYDHIGMSGNCEDRIYNGANDDGSGTVSVVELASALTTLKERPKRSLVFMTVFGEEKGLLGSRYYGRHPIFPIEKTIADINLEQVGRTDSTEGPQIANASMTGFNDSTGFCVGCRRLPL